MTARPTATTSSDASTWGQRRTGDGGVDVVALAQLLRRRIRLAIVAAGLMSAAAAVVILRLPDVFTAETIVVLDARASRLAELRSPVDSLLSRTPADLSVMRTEVDALTSPEHYRTVVDRLALTADPLVLPPSRSNAIQRLYRAALTAAHRRFGWPASAGGATADPDLQRERAVERLARMVTVINEGGSYTLRIRVESPAAELSAKIANALAAAYLEGQQRQKGGERQAATAWLGGRMGELRTAAIRADEGVERFRATNQLGNRDEPSLLDSQAAQISEALVAAHARYSRTQADFAEAEATARRRGGDVGTASSVLASPTIQALRTQESEIMVKRGLLLQAYQPRHPSVLAVDAELAAARAKIRLEVERIVASLRGEVSAAQREIEDLERQLEALDKRRADQAEAQVTLAGLEREARANRRVLDQFLEQFNAIMAQEAGQQPDARLIATARPPLSPSGPPRKLLLAGAGAGSLAFGVALALAVGLRRGGIPGREELEQQTGLPVLELVPEYSRSELRRLLASGSTPELTNPIRSLAITLEAGLVTVGPKPVVLVTSSVAAEGKSVLSLTLAQALARRQRRTLLIDLDFWRPSQVHLPDGDGDEDERPVRRVAGLRLRKRSVDGLYLLAPDAPIASSKRGELVHQILDRLDDLRADFDVVVLDTPPILAIPEVLTAARQADVTLLVVRFERTSASDVQAALDRLARIGVRPSGTVLSRIHPGNYRRYGYGEVNYARAS